MVNFYNELKTDFLEVDAMQFYRDIFPLGALDTKDAFTKGKFVGIACEFTDKYKYGNVPLVKRYSITDDLDTIKMLLNSENFVITSPISYVGKERTTKNARVMYAFAIEIDGILINKVGRAAGYHDLKHHMKQGFLPTCNYIVASGNGLHLYYLFDEPLILYPNVVKSLVKYKKEITPMFWNRYITSLFEHEKIQYESAFQGFRLAGSLSKKGDRTKIFKVSDERCSIEYLNSFVYDKKNSIDVAYKSNLTLAKAKEKYPEWYEKRIIKGLEKDTWTCKRDLYDWWLREIKDKAKVGHRYHCLMILSIYAIKSGISYEELVKDCFDLLEPFDKLSNESTNSFTKKDVIAALQSFLDKDLVTFPLNSIIKLSGIAIEKNRRNYRKQDLHLKGARAIQEINNPNWRYGNGRPKGSGTKEEMIKDFLEKHKNVKLSVTEIAKKLKVSRPTVYKYLK